MKARDPWVRRVTSRDLLRNQPGLWPLIARVGVSTLDECKGIMGASVQLGYLPLFFSLS